MGEVSGPEFPGLNLGYGVGLGFRGGGWRVELGAEGEEGCGGEVGGCGVAGHSGAAIVILRMRVGGVPAGHGVVQ